ncbi:polysialoglycoprotein, partial [Caerostris darwini]
MILAFCLLTLLVSANTCSAAIKGGPRIIQEPAVIQDVSQPLIHVSKGGGGGAIHHTAVVQDPISGPVVVEKVSRVGGIKTAGLGAGSAQFTLGDGLFGQRRLYRAGPASYPFGLTGLDYYSYPNSLLTAPRLSRGKTVVSPNLSGLRPIGLSSGLKGGIIADPTVSQFSIGDAQIKTNVFGARRNIYRTGLSPVPFGLMGLDYHSYPNNLLLQRSIDDGFGLRQTKILGGGSAFTAGDSQIRGPVVVAQSPVVSPIGQEKVTVVESDPLEGIQRVTTVQKAPTLGAIALGGPSVKTAQQVIPQQVSVLDDGLGEEFGQRKVTTTTITESADPIAAALGEQQITQTTVTKGGSGLSGLRGGQIILGGGPRIGGLRRVKTRPVIQEPAVVIQETSGLAPAIGGFGQRQVTLTQAAPAPVVQAPIIAQAPARILQAPIQVAPAPIVQAPVPIVQRPVIARRPGDVFLSQVARPQIATFARPAPIAVPIAQQRVLAPAPVAVPIAQQRVLAPAPVAVPIPQQRVIAPAGPFFGGGNIQFTLGGSQLIGGPIAAPAPVVAAPRPVVVAQAPRFVAQAPRQVVVSQAPRPVVVAQRPAVVAQAPVVVEQRPQILSQVKTSPGLLGNRRIFGRRIPQMVYVDGGNQFLGIDIVGGSRIGDPRFNYARLPYSAGRFSTLGSLSQARIPVSSFTSIDGQGSIDAGPTLVAPAPLPVIASLRKSPVLSVASPVAKTVSRVAAPLGLSPVGHTSSQVVTQEEVIGPVGDRQIVTTVTKSEPTIVSGPSKIGGAVVSSPLGLTAVGHTSPTKTITQEEVVGLGGDRQVVTTVTETDSNRLVGSKIGGAVVSSP